MLFWAEYIQKMNEYTKNIHYLCINTTLRKCQRKNIAGVDFAPIGCYNE